MKRGEKLDSKIADFIVLKSYFTRIGIWKLTSILKSKGIDITKEAVRKNRLRKQVEFEKLLNEIRKKDKQDEVIELFSKITQKLIDVLLTTLPQTFQNELLDLYFDTALTINALCDVLGSSKKLKANIELLKMFINFIEFGEDIEFEKTKLFELEKELNDSNNVKTLSVKRLFEHVDIEELKKKVIDMALMPFDRVLEKIETQLRNKFGYKETEFFFEYLSKSSKQEKQVVRVEYENLTLSLRNL